MSKPNYLAMYYKGGYHKEENRETPFDFTKSADYEKKIAIRNKTINKLKNLNSEIADMQIAEGLKLLPKANLNKYFIEYRPYRTYYEKNYFRATNGMRIEEENLPENKVTIAVEKKRGVFLLPYAYLYERGIVYVNVMRYAISPNNDAITFVRERVIACHIFSQEYFILEEEKFVKYENPINQYDFSHLTIAEFIQTMYGVDYAPNLTINTYAQAIKHNSTFEEMLKTSPKWVIDKFLSVVTPAKSILEFFNITKEYKYLIEDEKTFMEFITLKEEFVDRLNIREKNKMTVPQVLELLELFHQIIEECQMHEIVMEGRYDSKYLSGNHRFDRDISGGIRELIRSWNTEVIREHYTPRKYYEYLMDAVVNQGFTSISEFRGKIRDYLRMCDQQQIQNPALYSDYLRRTHDTLARNQKIKLDREEKENFIKQYEDVKYTYIPKDNNLCIVQPTIAQDVIDEGNMLGHCVASYVKRIAAGKTHIVFLRNKDDQDKSVVTVQVTNGEVVQARGKSNHKPSKKQIEFLKSWAEKKQLTWRIS